MTISCSSTRSSGLRNKPSGRPLRQVHFPDRKRLTIPSTKPRTTRFLNKRQSTLTQLNYINPSSFEDDADEISEFDDIEYIETRPRKRRRVDTNQAADDDVKQSTLTQWEWLNASSMTDEEDEASEDENNDAQAYQEPSLEGHDEHQSGGHNILSPDRIRIKQEKTTQPCVVSPSSEARRSAKRQSSASPSRKQGQPKSPIFKTPQKPIKREIPSSQSPPETPLSTQEDSPLSHRTPLQEIPPNVLAMLDESPSRKAKPMGDRGSPRGAASSDDKENFADTPTEKVFTKETQMQSSVAKSPVSSSQSQSIGRSREPREMPPPSVSQFSASSPEKSHHSAARPSQATTVDITQHSSAASPEFTRGTRTSIRARSPIHQPSTPMAFESQLPQFYLSAADIESYSPLSSLHDSADIVTVSQLLPESMLESSQAIHRD